MATTPTSEHFYLADADVTERVGGAIARVSAGGMVLALYGELGAGKTTLVRGGLRARGWTGPVKSPTYTLVEHYLLSSLYFYHFDFYRFTDPAEWETAGLAECFRDDSVCLVEWPERIGERLPQADLDVTLALPPEGTGRLLELRARSPAGERCLAAVRALRLPPWA